VIAGLLPTRKAMIVFLTLTVIRTVRNESEMMWLL
jgi:hypothetical protein